MSRIHRLLPWAIVVATVNLVLQAIESRAGALGRFVIGFIGMAWRVVTFLVVPILVFENIGPVDAVKRSATLFKKTWGENLAAQVGFGLLGFVAIIPAIIIAGLLIATGVAPLIVLGIIAAVVWIGLASIAISTLNGIFQTALYRYAADGTIPAAFAGTGLEGSFTQK